MELKRARDKVLKHGHRVAGLYIWFFMCGWIVGAAWWLIFSYSYFISMLGTVLFFVAVIGMFICMLLRLRSEILLEIRYSMDKTKNVTQYKK